MTVRALHICDFSAPYPGAFIRQLRMLADELAQRDGGTLAFAFPERASGAHWLTELREDGLTVVLLPEPSHTGSRRIGTEILQHVQELDPQIIHSHFGGYDLAAAWAARRAGRRGAGSPRLIWHYRTALEEPVAGRSIVRRAKDLLRYRIGGRHVDACIAVTEALAEEAGARGMGSRARAVVAGCDTDTFRPDAVARDRVRAALGVAPDAVMILHLGWHWHRKGGDLLAAALRELSDRGVTGITAYSVGAPAEELEDPVHRLEFRDAINELHQASDIFVSASRSEGFGNGLVEGMACGRVAVAALVDGQREIFSDLAGCRAVPPESAQDLADGIEELLRQRDQWSTFGEHNRAHVERYYSMRSWAQRMADVYGSLAGTAATAVSDRRAA